MRKSMKKVISLAVASFITVTSIFNGNEFTTNAKETIVDAIQENAEQAYNVSFVAPTNSYWNKEGYENYKVYAYAFYYDPTVDYRVEGTLPVEPLGEWPGTQLDANNSISINAKGNTAYVQFLYINPSDIKADSDSKPEPACRVPWSPDVRDGNYGGYAVTGDTVFDFTKNEYPVITEFPELKRSPIPATATPIVTVAPTTSAAVTATPTTVPSATVPSNTATPTVTTSAATTAPTVEPVVGPQVIASVANGTSFTEKVQADGLNVTDTMDVTLKLAEGATSATYTVDNGVPTTITQDTTIQIGEGKIANKEIELKVISTDGTNTNTQIFHYYKKTAFANAVPVSAKMVKLFGSVKAAAVTATTTTVSFKKPADEKWKDADVYAYVYYKIEGESYDAGKANEKPFGYWPGKLMTGPDSNGVYTIDVDTNGYNAYIIFAAYDKEAAAVMASATPIVVTDAPGATPALHEPYYPIDDYRKDQLPNGAKDVGYAIAPGKSYSFDFTAETTPTPATSVESSTQTTVAPSATPVSSATVAPSATPVSSATVAPSASPVSSATVVPSATPANDADFDAYFGASLSAPQYNTTVQTMEAVVVNGTANIYTYTFLVDGSLLERTSGGATRSITWDPRSLSAGKHTIGVVISDGKTSRTIYKTYTLAASAVVPSTTDTSVSASPEVSTVPGVSTGPSATATPLATTTPDATTSPTITETPAASIAPVSVSGSVSFNKTGKTVGEAIKVSAKITSGSAPKPYKYTYAVTKSGKTTYLAKKTKSTSKTWIPSKKGTYTVKIYVYDANGTKVKTLSKKYTVKAKVITITSFKTSKKSGVKKGTKVTISAKAKTTKGKVSYKFIVKNSKGTTVASKSYSKTAKKVWKTKKKGTYKIYLYVKNGKGVEVYKTKTFKVK